MWRRIYAKHVSPKSWSYCHTEEAAIAWATEEDAQQRCLSWNLEENFVETFEENFVETFVENFVETFVEDFVENFIETFVETLVYNFVDNFVHKGKSQIDKLTTLYLVMTMDQRRKIWKEKSGRSPGNPLLRLSHLPLQCLRRELQGGSFSP